MSGVSVDLAFCRRLGIEPTDLYAASNAAFDNPQVERVLKVLQGRIKRAWEVQGTLEGLAALDDAAGILRTVLV